MNAASVPGHGRVLRTLLVVATLALPGAGTPAQTEADAAMHRLISGGHVLLLRHALAPGTGDPPSFALRDCTTQRNLDERGRTQARAIGQWLRDRGLVEVEVFSSQWCRCLETARLLALGPVTELPALNSFYELPRTREPNLHALRAFLRARPADAPPAILVTHQVTIAAITGAGVSSGEGVIIELDGDAPYPARARLRFDH